MSKVENKNNQKRNPLFTIFIIVAIIGSTAFWYYTLYSPINLTSYEGTGYQKIPKSADNITKISIELYADVGEFSFSLLPESSSNAIEIDWDYSYLFKSEDTSEQPFIINAFNETRNGVLYYTIIVNFEEELNIFKLSNLDCRIKLAPGFSLYNITGNVKVGGINMDFSNMQFGDIVLSSDTSSYDCSIMDCNFTGYLSLKIDVGSIMLDLDNIYFLNSTLIRLESSVGSIEVDWEQTEPMFSDVDLVCVTETGSIDISIESLPKITRYDIIGETSTGSTDIYLTSGKNFEENHYKTIGFDDLSLPVTWIYATTSVGSIEIDVDLYS
ncbi:MAG: hypothetical protein K9W44_16925 [Candidatus Lokiarchaeota archaeon]|nr:hypothetical protein [Candidatus Harpocratesius repetitus]